MKKQITIIALFIAGFALKSNAQGLVSTFDNLPLPTGQSYWNGSDLSNGFTDGSMYFQNAYDTSFGGFWSTGFAYSAVVDTVTSGFGNLYAAIPGAGYNASAQYAVVQNNAVASVVNFGGSMIATGFYVTNGTYAYNSMRDGDFFARKFGDTTGTSSGLPQGSMPDYFKLTVKAYFNNQLSNDSVEFYLADYRFADDTLDYIVNTWEWVDLTQLGTATDSLLFTLSSSDNGAFGMNTPGFFCIDNLTLDYTVAAKNMQTENDHFRLYPNPASEAITIKMLNDVEFASLVVYDLNGRELIAKPYIIANERIDISALAAGTYIVKMNNGITTHYQKLIKN